jgi:hypothetical protein
MGWQNDAWVIFADGEELLADVARQHKRSGDYLHTKT